MHRAALVLVLVGTAGCVEMGAPDVPAGDEGLRADDARATSTLATVGETGADPEALCALLPDEGPCALACDPEALAQEWLLPDTCAAFVCDLTNGQRVTLHACRGE